MRLIIFTVFWFQFESLFLLVTLSTNVHADTVDHGRRDRLLGYIWLDNINSDRPRFFLKKCKKTCVSSTCCVLLAWFSHFLFSTVAAISTAGAEIAAVCRRAAFVAMEESMNIPHVSMRHFVTAVAQTPPRITEATLTFYADYAAKSAAKAV
jgi:hypothetical protein